MLITIMFDYVINVETVSNLTKSEVLSREKLLKHHKKRKY